MTTADTEQSPFAVPRELSQRSTSRVPTVLPEPIPRFGRSALWRNLQVFARISTTLLFDLQVHGVRNVPTRGGVLLATNHQSYLDPVLFAVRLSRPVSYLAKSELFENRFFSSFIRALHAFPVKQGRNDKAAMDQSIRLLRQGLMLNMYPEGSRTFDGKLQPMQRGVALIVRRAGVPVIPGAIEGSFDAWSRERKGIFRAHPIRIAYGRPMILHELPPEKIVAAIGDSIGSLHADLQAGRVPEQCR